MIEMQNNLKLFKILSFLSVVLGILIICQISLGASIRLTGSGLSCPDWPLCYGLWLPIKSKLILIDEVNYEYYQIMLEWLHRLNAALFIVPITILVSFLTIKISKNKNINKLAYLVLLVLFLQGLMGGFTVIDKNSPWSVAVHLGLALILLFLVIKIFMFSKNLIFTSNALNKKKNIFVFSLTLLFIFLTMLMGAIVSKSGSSLACDLWPLCSDDNLSLFQTNKFIHIVHRALALLSSFLIIWSLILLREFKDILYIQYIRAIVLLLIVMQIFVGAMVIFYEVNIAIAMIHQILAVLLFMMISSILWFSLNLKINN